MATQCVHHGARPSSLVNAQPAGGHGHHEGADKRAGRVPAQQEEVALAVACLLEGGLVSTPHSHGGAAHVEDRRRSSEPKHERDG
eukprot:1518890-Prymnesium_polylepis.2